MFFFFFCRIFSISCNIFYSGHSHDELGFLSKQVIGILLQQCNGNWGHPCNIDGPFSGNVVSFLQYRLYESRLQFLGHIKITI